MAYSETLKPFAKMIIPKKKQFKFSGWSNRRLNTCHLDMQLIMRTALRVSDIDFGIADGHRSKERQYKYFKQGKSKIDGITRLSKHNYKPSLAADFYAYYDGKAQYEKEALTYIAGLIQGVAGMLFMAGKIEHLVRWGGNWDRDSEILTDQSFDDRPHIELYRPEIQYK